MKKTAVKLRDNPLTELLSKLDRKTLAIWAIDCAEHVLPYFEEKHPEDNRPRKAIEAGRAWARGEIAVSEARTAALAAHAAARDANQESARAAARAAGHAAATAHVVGHAPHAANYAVKAAGYDSDAAASARERDWQYHPLAKTDRESSAGAGLVRRSIKSESRMGENPNPH